jgi:O-acetyl-ADP-ribose deacetylase (regulator of RNase III)
MIQLTKGDILTAKTEALVNTVNCVGVMGRGIALQFRKAFPGNFKAYKKACDNKQVQPGKMFIYDLNRLDRPHFIINFPTKQHWKNKSRIEDIKSGLVDLVSVVQQQQIHSIAIPPLGCGLGGLNWDEVRPLIFEALKSLPEVDVLLFEPVGTPQATAMVKEKKVPKMTVGRAALLGLIRRYLSAVMEPSVTLLEVHKLMYFMQEAGEPLRLDYQKAPYGPYAKNLRHLLNHIEGHFISGYGDAEDRPDKPLELNLFALKQANEFLKNHEVTRQRFDRVANLITGFETTFGMELLSTVHWVVTNEDAVTKEQVVTKVHSWNERKSMFTPRHIERAWDCLQESGWITQP